MVATFRPENDSLVCGRPPLFCRKNHEFRPIHRRRTAPNRTDPGPMGTEQLKSARLLLTALPFLAMVGAVVLISRSRIVQAQLNVARIENN